MRVVGLVSGGKDSLYGLMQCVRRGHTIVAIANLRPADVQQDEVESHMFQTIGHGIVEAIARCMGVPFFSLPIGGSSRLTDLNYVRTEGDEVEDLYRLLSMLCEAAPASAPIEAVSSGAILSSYQRLRVEHVCTRLGLTSLAYLWQLDQPSLLVDMVENGMEAILVKVASMGLNPRRHLGRSIAQLQHHLLHIGKEYGVHPCGEGGEFETLTLGCPLFRGGRRIQIEASSMIGDMHTDIAPVAVLRVEKFNIVKLKKTSSKQEDADRDAVDGAVYEPETDEAIDEATRMRVEQEVRDACRRMKRTALSSAGLKPLPYDDEENSADEGLAQSLGSTALFSNSSSAHSFISPFASSLSPSTTSDHGFPPKPSWQYATANVVGDHCFVASSALPAVDAPVNDNGSSPSGLAASSSSSSSSPPSSADVSSRVSSLLSSISSTLAERNFTFDHLMYVQLFLEDLARDFSRANAAYIQLVPMQAAASRACVQLDGHVHGHVTKNASTTSNAVVNHAPLLVDCIASRARREVLHVQSVSEWAPACIGPYSQANKCNHLIWLAGQIGLDPGSMRLFRSPSRQVHAALRHCHHVLHAQKSDLAHTVTAVVYWKANAWNNNQAVRSQLIPRCDRTMQQSVQRGTFIDEDEELNDPSHLSTPTKRTLCILHVAVPALPRDALLEAQLVALPSAPELPVTSFDPSTSTSFSSSSPFSPSIHSLSPSICHRSHATLARGLFASVWSAISIQHQQQKSSSTPQVRLVDALHVMIAHVQEAMKQAAIGWSGLLVYRIYFTPLVDANDLRLAVGDVLESVGAPSLAVSFLPVSDLSLHVLDGKAMNESSDRNATESMGLVAMHAFFLSQQMAKATFDPWKIQSDDEEEDEEES